MEKFPSIRPTTSEKESTEFEVRSRILAEAASITIADSDRNSEGKLLAANGKASNLDELEWKMVRTETFKQWFGDSLVVDDNGEPLLLYHGSSKQFNNFDLSEVGTSKDSGYFGTGLYFTPYKELAEKYGPILYKTFLKIENIQVFTEEHGNVRNFDENTLPENIRHQVLRRYDPLREKEHRRLKQQDEAHKSDWSYLSTWNGEDKFEYILSDVIREVLIEEGKDGVLGYNQHSKVYEYVAFNEDDILIVP